MADLRHVTYCGLYCKHCSNIVRIPQQARDLYETLKREGFDFFGGWGSRGLGEELFHISWVGDEFGELHRLMTLGAGDGKGSKDSSQQRGPAWGEGIFRRSKDLRLGLET